MLLFRLQISDLNAEFVTRLPDNDLGEAVLMDLRKHNVGTSHIVKGGERLRDLFP